MRGRVGAARAAAGLLLGALLGAVPAGAQEEEEPDLRERLTEREDRTRPEEPFSLDLAGRPLTLGGEYAFDLFHLRRRLRDPGAREPDRFRMEHALELEAFYGFGETFSAFLQGRVVGEKDLLPDTPEADSGVFAERAETWLHAENIGGSGVSADVGRLHFEDGRRWWWDEDLDALRVAYEGGGFEIALALARELGPSRSDRDSADPEDDRVIRLLGEASWDFARHHALELFGAYEEDRSPREAVGRIVRREEEDDSDARLLRLGARLSGAFDLGGGGVPGYALDVAVLRGRERFLSFEDAGADRSVAEEAGRRAVRGWALDAAVGWALPAPWEPRIFAGWAFGSGDSRPDSGADRSFRQTGLHANEPGFGGVERFEGYGIALDPKLSNLHVLTAGVGCSPLPATSLDVVYHRYRLASPASSLRDARIEAELDGRHRALGDGVDAVLAVEEWARLQLFLAASFFRPGPAFGPERGRWSRYFALGLTAPF